MYRVLNPNIYPQLASQQLGWQTHSLVGNILCKVAQAAHGSTKVRVLQLRITQNRFIYVVSSQ